MASSKVQKWETVPQNVRFQILKTDTVESEDYGTITIAIMKNLETKEITRYYCPERLAKERENHFTKTGHVKDTVKYYGKAKSKQGKEFHNFDLVSSTEFKELKENFNLYK